jgi:glycoside/pentoside/hexuronide:cation symporter, GPH family
VKAAQAWRGGWQQGLQYGALGLPLAFVALPLYVVLPNHYASVYGIPLATLGALLLGARLLDAVADPWIGRLADGWLAHSARRVLMVALIAAVVLALGFRGLFFPPLPHSVTLPGSAAMNVLLIWCAALLAVTYLSYSVLTVLHQAWGARLGGDEAQRARIVSWREGLALVGVLVASVLPSVAGLSVASAVFAALLLLALALLWRAPQPRIGLTAAAPSRAAGESAFQGPMSSPAFRRLLWVYVINGVASAVPATLVLFFIRDRLQAQNLEPLFLVSYFAAGALSMPLWLRLVARLGLARAWLLGMALAVISFVWAAGLGAGDVWGFAAVCVASGVALGADLSLPSALLAGVIQRAGHGQRLEGAYFGWWNFATKLNLALAAGVALPLLALFGYAPGARDGAALQALTLAYCVLPCGLKLLAAGLLWMLLLRKEKTA